MADDLWATDGGLYFGHRVMPDRARHDRSLLDEEWQVVRDKLHRYIGDRHVVTVGPSGSGKTRRLLIPNLLLLPNWSVLVVDPKGTLAALTGPYREARHPNSVIVIDPFGVLENEYPGLVRRYPFLKSAGFNPIAALDPESDDFADDARGLGEAIVPLEDQDHPHWDHSGADFAAGVFMFDRVDNCEQGSLVSVRDLVSAEAEALANEIESYILPRVRERYPAIAAKLGRFSHISADNRELLSIISTVQTKTAWLDSPPIQRDLSKGAFDFGQMKYRPLTTYLILPPRYLASHSTFLRIMVTAVLQPLMRSVRPAKVPVLFMLDEFAQLGSLLVIENNLALLREYGVKLWVVYQDLAQAQAISKARWESFVANAGVVQAFAPQDVLSRKHLSELSGERLYWMQTRSRNSSGNAGPHLGVNNGMQEGWQHITGPVFWPQGLAAMQDGQAVLLARGRSLRAYLPDPSEMSACRSILARAMREMNK